ncbi:MAG TPA: phosphatase PAP2 family protein [Candidatus Eremiobacteraceae bacterium]|nr:phosphatase PAP2 family protein [Candidatus Eremiobacteraceae bacterium]
MRRRCEIALVQSAQFFHSLWQHASLNAAMIALARYGLLISFVVMLAALARARSAALLLWLGGGALLAAALTYAAGRMLFDPRPFTVLPVTPLVAHAADNGFPSDHSSVAAFIAAAVWFVDARLALVASLAALAIGFARAYCFLHWPADVLAGWCIGALPAVLAGYGWRRHVTVAA